MFNNKENEEKRISPRPVSCQFESCHKTELNQKMPQNLMLLIQQMDKKKKYQYVSILLVQVRQYIVILLVQNAFTEKADLEGPPLFAIQPKVVGTQMITLIQ